jgi:hypothetical protein
MKEKYVCSFDLLLVLLLLALLLVVLLLVVLLLIVLLLFVLLLVFKVETIIGDLFALMDSVLSNVFAKKHVELGVSFLMKEKDVCSLDSLLVLLLLALLLLALLLLALLLLVLLLLALLLLVLFKVDLLLALMGVHSDVLAKNVLELDWNDLGHSGTFWNNLEHSESFWSILELDWNTPGVD